MLMARLACGVVVIYYLQVASFSVFQEIAAEIEQDSEPACSVPGFELGWT